MNRNSSVHEKKFSRLVGPTSLVVLTLLGMSACTKSVQEGQKSAKEIAPKMFTPKIDKLASKIIVSSNKSSFSFGSPNNNEHAYGIGALVTNPNTEQFTATVQTTNNTPDASKTNSLEVTQMLANGGSLTIELSPNANSKWTSKCIDSSGELSEVDQSSVYSKDKLTHVSTIAADEVLNSAIASISGVIDNLNQANHSNSYVKPSHDICTPSLG